MTSQALTANPSVRVSNPQLPTRNTEKSTVDQHRSRLIEAMKAQYQLDQQLEFLHLQAETESLLQQLQAIKQRRETSVASSQS